MNSKRVSDRGLITRKKMGATLKGFKLQFNKLNAGNLRSGHANIEYNKNGSVEGVLYELASPEEILKMDVFERAPINYGRDVVCLETVMGKRWAWTYFANKALLKENLLPERDYLDHLLEGKRYLSDSYYRYLEAVKVF